MTSGRRIATIATAILLGAIFTAFLLRDDPPPAAGASAPVSSPERSPASPPDETPSPLATPPPSPPPSSPPHPDLRERLKQFKLRIDHAGAGELEALLRSEELLDLHALLCGDITATLDFISAPESIDLLPVIFTVLFTSPPSLVPSALVGGIAHVMCRGIPEQRRMLLDCCMSLNVLPDAFHTAYLDLVRDPDLQVRLLAFRRLGQLRRPLNTSEYLLVRYAIEQGEVTDDARRAYYRILAGSASDEGRTHFIELFEKAAGTRRVDDFLADLAEVSRHAPDSLHARLSSGLSTALGSERDAGTFRFLTALAIDLPEARVLPLLEVAARQAPDASTKKGVSRVLAAYRRGEKRPEQLKRMLNSP